MKIECNITPEQNKRDYEEAKKVIESDDWGDMTLADVDYSKLKTWEQVGLEMAEERIRDYNNSIEGEDNA